MYYNTFVGMASRVSVFVSILGFKKINVRFYKVYDNVSIFLLVRSSGKTTTVLNITFNVVRLTLRLVGLLSFLGCS